MESGDWSFTIKLGLWSWTPRRFPLQFFGPGLALQYKQSFESRLYIILLPGPMLALKLRRSTLWGWSQKKMDKSFDISPFCLNPKIRSAHSCRWADTCLDSNAYEIIRLRYGHIPRLRVGSVSDSGNLPSYPSLAPMLTITSHRTKCQVRGGMGVQF